MSAFVRQRREDLLDIQVRVGYKFACMALGGPPGPRPAGLCPPVAGSTWILAEAPVGFDATWLKWLGSLQDEQFRKSSLFLLAAGPAQYPAILDRETEALENRLHCLLCGLLLEGTARYHHGILVTGANESGSPDVRHVVHLKPRHQHYRATQRAVSQSLVRDALRSADGLAELFGGVLAHVETDPAAPQAHGRLRRGFNVLLRAFEESYANNRLHQFVRAVEAVLLPARGRTKTQFAHRCGLFAGASAPVRRVLEQMYDLRSTTEHLNDYEPILSDEPDPERVAFKRAYQAELLACGIYRRILHDRVLRDHFATDDSTARFWRTPDDEIKHAWGMPLTIERT